MSSNELSPPLWVDTPEALDQMLADLSVEAVIAFDTESDSLYRYHYKVCLIQVSTSSTDYLVDPLRLKELRALGALMADPRVEKVFHAAENDILVLKRDYAFSFANIFDTMMAARILGWPQVGLAALLRDRFQVEVDKRAQLTDWGRRPLTLAQRRYARLDTHYLLALRRALREELITRRRWREAQEAFAALPNVRYVEKPFDPDGFWRTKGARKLRSEDLAILRELYIWRDRQASALDRPPFKVMPDSTMLLLAKNRFRGPEELPLNPRQIDHFGQEIMEAIRAGMEAPAPTMPERSHDGRPSPDTLSRYERLRSWRTARAIERGVDSDLVMTNDTLMTIAKNHPSTQEELATSGLLGPWKLETYGEELLEALAGVSE